MKKKKVIKKKTETKKVGGKRLNMKHIEERIKEIENGRGFLLAFSVDGERRKTTASVTLKGISANDFLAELERIKMAFLFGRQKKEEKKVSPSYAQ